MPNTSEGALVAPKRDKHTQRWGSQDQVARAADGPTIKVPAQQLTLQRATHIGAEEIQRLWATQKVNTVRCWEPSNCPSKEEWLNATIYL